MLPRLSGFFIYRSFPERYRLPPIQTKAFLWEKLISDQFMELYERYSRYSGIHINFISLSSWVQLTGGFCRNSVVNVNGIVRRSMGDAHFHLISKYLKRLSRNISCVTENMWGLQKNLRQELGRTLGRTTEFNSHGLLSEKWWTNLFLTLGINQSINLELSTWFSCLRKHQTFHGKIIAVIFFQGNVCPWVTSKTKKSILLKQKQLSNNDNDSARFSVHWCVRIVIIRISERT